jgi:hypothetical protein
MASSVLCPAEAQSVLPAGVLRNPALGYVTSSALDVVNSLGIAQRLSAGPRPVGALAREAGANEDALYRVMRMLAAEGVFEEIGPQTFATTPLSGPLPTHSRTGRTPELSDVFDGAKASLSAMVAPAVLEAYDFSGIDLLVAVAGGHGKLLTSVLKAYPTMKGVLFDLPYVVEGARPAIHALGLQSRCRAEGGDLFTAVPRGGDAYVMQNILRYRDDGRGLAILRNIRAALRDGRGKVLLLESGIAPGGQPDVRALLAAAGFALTRVVRTRAPLSVVEGEAQ